MDRYGIDVARSLTRRLDLRSWRPGEVVRAITGDMNASCPLDGIDDLAITESCLLQVKPRR